MGLVFGRTPSKGSLAAVYVSCVVGCVEGVCEFVVSGDDNKTPRRKEKGKCSASLFFCSWGSNPACDFPNPQTQPIQSRCMAHVLLHHTYTITQASDPLFSKSQQPPAKNQSGPSPSTRLLSLRPSIHPPKTLHDATTKSSSATSSPAPSPRPPPRPHRSILFLPPLDPLAQHYPDLSPPLPAPLLLHYSPPLHCT